MTAIADLLPLETDASGNLVFTIGKPGQCRYCQRPYELLAQTTPSGKGIMYYRWMDKCCPTRALAQAAVFEALALEIETREKRKQLEWQQALEIEYKAAKTAEARQDIRSRVFRDNQAALDEAAEHWKFVRHLNWWAREEKTRLEQLEQANPGQQELAQQETPHE